MSRTYKDTESGKKQWRHHCNNHRGYGRGYGGYNRAHMKRIHNTEEGTAIIKQDNASWKYGFGNDQPSYKLIKRFLYSHVGQPWVEVEQELHTHTELLRNRGVNIDIDYYVATHENARRWARFYVDDKGILQHSRPYTKNHDIRIPVNPTRRYRLTDAIRRANHSSGPAYKKHLALFETLSARDYATLMEGTAITEKAYEKMQERYSNKYTSIVERYRQEYVGPYGEDGYWDRHAKWGSCMFTSLFVMEEVCDEVHVIKYRSKEYKRYYAEKIKSARHRRYGDQERMEREMEVLRTREADRKVKEAQENHISIIRHGFDEQESFRGLEYHGQKRKRKALAG